MIPIEWEIGLKLWLIDASRVFNKINKKKCKLDDGFMYSFYHWYFFYFYQNDNLDFQTPT